MKNMLVRFNDNEDGAVTADWVVLTSAIVGLNIFGIIAFIEEGLAFAGHEILSSVEETSDYR